MIKKLLLVIIIALSLSISTKALTIEQGELVDGWSWFRAGPEFHYVYNTIFIPIENADTIYIQIPINYYMLLEGESAGIQYNSWVVFFDQNRRETTRLTLETFIDESIILEVDGLLIVDTDSIILSGPLGTTMKTMSFMRFEILHKGARPIDNYIDWWSDNFIIARDEEIQVVEFGVNLITYYLFNEVYYTIFYNDIPNRPLDPFVAGRNFICWLQLNGECYNFDEALPFDFSTQTAVLFAGFEDTTTPIPITPNNPVGNIDTILTGLGLDNIAGKLFIYAIMTAIFIFIGLSLNVGTMAVFILVAILTIVLAFLGFFNLWVLILIILGYAVTFIYALKEDKL